MTLLRLAIRGAGLTQVALAQAVGLTEKHMSQLTTGKVFMSMDCAAKIGQALGVNPTALLVAHSVERAAMSRSSASRITESQVEHDD
jgi:plasmid maintenance system antidote protein VapI